MIALLNLGFVSEGGGHYRMAEFNLTVRVEGTAIYMTRDDKEILITLPELEAYVEELL